MSVVTQQVEVRRLWSALPTPQTYGSQHSQQGGSLSSSPGHPLQGITQADICRGCSHSVWRTCVMAGGTETLFCVLVTGVGSSCSNIVLEALVRSHNMAARGPQRAARPCSSHCVIDNSFIFITIINTTARSRVSTIRHLTHSCAEVWRRLSDGCRGCLL